MQDAWNPAQYDRFRAERQQPFFDLLAMVRPRDGMNIVDLGCGTGLAGSFLRPRARHLTGIDLSPEMVAKAETTGLYHALDVAEITEWLERSDTPLDLITACDTLIYFGKQHFHSTVVGSSIGLSAFALMLIR